MMKSIFITAILVSSISMLFAQQNLVKVNLIGLAGRNLTVGYERVINERQSAAITIGFPLGLPGFGQDLIEGELLSNGVSSDLGVSGIRITPQYRFYGAKKEAPRGFYWAPYLNFSNRALSFSGQYDGQDTDVSFGIRGIGAGIQLGAQWLIKDVVCIDWYFLGLGANWTTVQGTYAAADLSEIEDDVRSETQDIPVIGDRIEVSNDGNELRAKLSMVLPSFRTGISFGVFF